MRRIVAGGALAALLAGMVVVGGAVPASALDVAPLATIDGANTLLSGVGAIAVNGDGSMAVASTNQPFAVRTFAADAIGNAAPVRSIAGDATKLDSPISVALDVSGNYVVANCAVAPALSSITIYPAITSGNTAPSRTISGSNTHLTCPVSVAVDSGGQIYVGDIGDNDLIGPSIIEFTSGANGNVNPVRTLSPASIAYPSGLALDSSNRLYVTDYNSPASVSVFALNASGSAAPLRKITGAGTGLSSPTDVAVDSAGRTYVANEGTNSVTVYSAAAADNAAPSATIAGPNTLLAGPRGIALNSDGSKVYVTNGLNDSITVFGTSLGVAGAPTVTSVGPAVGPIAGGTAITITGTGFTNGAGVKVGGKAATSVSVVSATSITATTPDGTRGAADVVVTNPDALAGTLASGFAYVTVPDAPTAVTVVASDRSADVSWTAPADDGGSAITGYSVLSSPDSSTSEAFSCSAPTAAGCTVNGLTNGHSYTFKVRATNLAGSGAYSAWSSAAVPSSTPQAPIGVTGTRGDGKVTVSWTAPADGGSAITSYTATASPGGATCTTPNGTTLHCDVIDLINGQAYTFTVVASNARGPGAVSDQSAPVVPATTPNAPTGVSALRGAASATVTWSAPGFDGGDAIDGYKVTSDPGGRVCTSTGALLCTVLGLTNGASYTFTVQAHNAMGYGTASSATDPVVPASNPGAPTAVKGVRGNARITVTWRAPTSTGGLGLSKYVVTATPGGRTCTVLAPGTSCVVTGLTNGVGYRFSVRATGDPVFGPGPASALSAVVVPSTVPGAPTSPRATYPAARRTLLVWRAPRATGGAAILRYEVRLSANAGRSFGSWVRGTRSTYLTLRGLAKGALYRVQVRAVNVAGAGIAVSLWVRPTK